MNKPTRSIAIAVLATSAIAHAQAPVQPLDAAASDPIAMGWMIGSPPPADRTIRFDDSSHYRFPQIRWTFSHWREIMPTVNVSRGGGPVSVLPRAERKDLDAVSFTPLGGSQPMSWAQSLAANYTDGIVVLHRGVIVYERYFGALTPERPHIAMSVTKSFFGTLAAALIADGVLDPDSPVKRYVPELEHSAFGDATVRQVLDMTTGLDFNENYADPKAPVWAFARAGGFLPRPAGDDGPRTLYEYLPTVMKDGEHGQAFSYKSPNTEVLAWIIRRVTGKSAAQYLQERIWSKLGAEQDAHLHVDSQGTAFGAGGLNTTLRDLARFGEMMRLGGRYNGQQIIPATAIADIRRGGSLNHFAKASYKLLPGWSYRDQWWVSHNAHGAYSARGVHGQVIYVDPKAEMVIARYASHPLAANANFDPTSLPAYAALAEHLMAGPP